jgi:predicted AlkP superfamily pyrophosphatase or phosphodiesterase
VTAQGTRRTVVLDVVGLATGQIGEHTPNLARLAKAQGGARPLETLLPAVTCSVQASMLTGLPVSEHGVVGNGWYWKDLAEVMLWRQVNRITHGEKVWEAAKKRDASVTCAKMFWWFNMYSSADFAVTPRPMYPADGRKIPDIYTEPEDLRDELNAALGAFPLFDFWGPRAGIRSSQWIAQASKRVFDEKKPTLSLVYLPHLDYDLQRFGPGDPRVATALREIDDVVGDLVEHFTKAGARVIVLSEYVITKVSRAVHPNRALRDAGLLRVRRELGTEKLDCGGSEAFAVADHQIAHVYVKSPERLGEVKKLLGKLPGVAEVLDAAAQTERKIQHERGGDLVLVADEDAWFTYYFWNDDDKAPDYARTVDIHRKPGYDPVELFLDPSIPVPQLKVGFRLAQKVLGFRYLMDVIPLDASLVKGSHGRPRTKADEQPVLLSTEPSLLPAAGAGAHVTDIKRIILEHLFD